jgi:Ca2+-binding RTX toxin-like protein
LASGAGKVTSVDASQLTSIKEFAVFGTTNTITKVGTGSILDINAGTVKTTVSGAVGTSDLTINIGSAAATSYITNGALDVTGLTNVTVNANIKAGATGLTHNLGTLTNSDNSTFTIKGNGNLTVALATATQTGSKIDGSASTGNLTLMGNGAALNGSKASLGDILIGGSGNDVIQSGANSSTLTGNAGKDTFDLTLAVAGATTPVTTITDFSKGDMIKFGTDFKTTSLVSKVDLSGVAAGKTDQQIAALLEAGTATKGDVAWGVYNGNTYAVEDTGTIKSLDTGDIVVKMIGVLDLSTSTHAVDQVLTFA